MTDPTRPDPTRPDPTRPDATRPDPIHPRQRARAKVLAFVLAGLAILFFAITIVKIRNGHA